MNRSDLRQQAKDAFKANYWPMVGIVFLAGVISSAIAGVISGVAAGGALASELASGGASLDELATSMRASFSASGLSTVVSIFVLVPLEVGLSYMCYLVFEGKKAPEVKDLFCVFNGKNYLRVVLNQFLVMVFITLWSLLLIIPGIVMSYAYSLAPFMLLDDPELGAMEAIKKSKEWAKGYKMDMFLIDLGFIGWGILTICTCGIVGIFWAIPYYSLAMAGIYSKIKAAKNESNVMGQVVSEQYIQ